MDDRRKKGEFVGALGALLVHVAVIALLILVSFTVPQPDEDAGGVPVMLGNVESARGFDDPSLVDVDIDVYKRQSLSNQIKITRL